ncbi:MAG: glycosyltransferase family 2 protein [Phycisphaerales bacterium]|nr:glycosyltransferase family 2 protein [Phycisphaerales bacterium]
MSEESGGVDSKRVSVLILTRNEEVNIERCLRALSWSDDIVVLDSESTDRTRELASSFKNVRVYTRAFDQEYTQRNYGLHSIEYKNPWVYICDADERVPPELRDEILRAVNDTGNDYAAFRVRFQNIFMGRWIKRSSNYPVWVIRLVRPGSVRYEERATNVHPIVDGTIGSLTQHFLHHSFNAGLDRWYRKHNFYSDREAEEAVKQIEGGFHGIGSLLSRDPMLRRRSFKNLSFFVPARGALRFVYSYLLGRGFADGPAGLQYCKMVSIYEYWIEMKTIERRSDPHARTRELAERLLGGGR